MIVSGLLFPVQNSNAQTQPTPSPCKDSRALKQFDFWLGHWQVKLADGTIAGENTITREQNGCVLVENWHGARGGSGISLNYFDQAKQQWVQIWTGSEGSQIQITGGLQNGSMLLVGKISTLGQTGSADFRGTWTLLEDGRVRQFFEQYDDKEKIWQPWFEGYYEKIERR
jgi:hypothetical protein